MRLHPRELNLVQSIIRATPGRRRKGYENQALDAAQAPAFRKFKYIACPFGIQIYIAQITRETKTRVFMPFANRPDEVECGFNKLGSISLAGWDHRYFETFQEAKAYLLFMANTLTTYFKGGDLDKHLCEFQNQIELLTEDLVYEVDSHWEIKKGDQPRWKSPRASKTRERNYDLTRYLQHFSGPLNFYWKNFWFKESVLAGYRYPIRGARPHWTSSDSFPSKGAA